MPQGGVLGGSGRIAGWGLGLPRRRCGRFMKIIPRKGFKREYDDKFGWKKQLLGLSPQHHAQRK
jgi:hypothetical protein